MYHLALHKRNPHSGQVIYFSALYGPQNKGDDFSIQLYPTGLYNRHGDCLLHRTCWAFKHNLDQSLVRTPESPSPTYFKQIKLNIGVKPRRKAVSVSEPPVIV